MFILWHVLPGNKQKPQVGCVIEHLKCSPICVFHKLVLSQVFKLQLVFIIMLLISLGLNTRICLCVHLHILYVHICVSENIYIYTHTHSGGMCAYYIVYIKRFCAHMVVCAAHSCTQRERKKKKRNFIFRQVVNTKSLPHIPEIWVMLAELRRGEMWGFLFIFKGNTGTE